MGASRPLSDLELEAMYRLSEARALSRVPALALDGRLGMRAVEELRALRAVLAQTTPGAVTWDYSGWGIRSAGGEQ